MNSNRTNIPSPTDLHNNKNNINNNSKKDLPISESQKTTTNNKINDTNHSNTNDNKKKDFTDEEAAIKIQSSFRGYKTREEIRKHV